MSLAERAVPPSPSRPAGASATGTQTSGLLTVDLKAVAENYRRLQALAPAAEVAAVVKADAYGLGAVPVVNRLLAEGCRSFYVASLDEGLALRDRCAPMIRQASVSVFNGIPAEGADALRRAHLRPVLNTREQIATWSAFACAQSQKLETAIHIDTGMNRLGLSLSDAAALAADPAPLTAVRITHWLSHLASPDTPDSPQNWAQRDRFLDAVGPLPQAPLSFANSAGVLLGPDFVFDQVRPGYALYGGNPVPGIENPFMPAVALEVPILQVRQIAAGETVGYGATYEAPGPRRLATLGIGYADGLFRQASNRGAVAIAGCPAPIVGRVSMDYATVDVSDIPDSLLDRASGAEVIGPNRRLEDVADSVATIGYEVLTALGGRFERRYLGEAG